MCSVHRMNTVHPCDQVILLKSDKSGKRLYMYVFLVNLKIEPIAFKPKFENQRLSNFSEIWLILAFSQNYCDFLILKCEN